MSDDTNDNFFGASLFLVPLWILNWLETHWAVKYVGIVALLGIINMIFNGKKSKGAISVALNLGLALFVLGCVFVGFVHIFQ